MIAKVDIVTVLFGSLGGIAAIVMAVNTWLVRRETKKEKADERSGTRRMDTFEMSQASLQAALTRADEENKRLYQQLERQEEEITDLKIELARLRGQVEGMSRDKP